MREIVREGRFPRVQISARRVGFDPADVAASLREPNVSLQERPHLALRLRLPGRQVLRFDGPGTKRAAEAVERKKRLDAATGSRADAGELTLDQAVVPFWDEVSPQIKDADHLKRRIDVMLSCYGKPNA